jgi:CRISPR-associated protein Csy1
MGSNERAYFERAQRHHQKGELAEALLSVEQAIAAAGEVPAYLLLRGHILHDRGELEEAEACLTRLAAVRADWAAAHVSLGAVRMDRGDLPGAEAAFRAGTVGDPRHPRAWQNLGAALRAQGRNEEAVHAFEQAIAIEPGYALAHLNLAGVCRSRDASKALAHAEAALRIDPNLAEARLLASDLRATLLADAGRIGAAKAAYEEAARRFPASLKAALGSALILPRIYESEEHLEASRAAYAQGLEALHEGAERFRSASPEAAMKEAAWVNFHLAYQGRDDRALQERYASLVRRVLERQLPRYFERRPRRQGGDDRIRVGFLSHFFFNSVVGRYFASWITRLDRTRFEPFVYYTNEWIADDTRTIAAASATFRHFADRPQLAIADQVIADGLDVLVYPELGMHPETFALAALRLAPVQCAGWGHPVTTGIAEIDWFISCEGMEPPGCEAHYRERVALLPGLGTRYAIPRADEKGSRADFGIPEDATAYLVPQSLFKIHPENDALVAEVLARDPKGVVVMFPARQELFTKTFKERFGASLARRGLDPGARIRWLKFVPHGTYLRVNQLCDVMLDTVHWSGGNTALDAIASGLPIVTLPGALMRGRQSAAMLRGVGLDELVAADAAAYVDIAVRLGKEADFRGEMSRRIVAGRGSLFEREEPVRAFERFLERAAAEAH